MELCRIAKASSDSIQFVDLGLKITAIHGQAVISYQRHSQWGYKGEGPPLATYPIITYFHFMHSVSFFFQRFSSGLGGLQKVRRQCWTSRRSDSLVSYELHRGLRNTQAAFFIPA